MKNLAEMYAAHSAVKLVNPVRRSKHEDDPRYWSYSDKDYERVRILKTHKINEVTGRVEELS